MVASSSVVHVPGPVRWDTLPPHVRSLARPTSPRRNRKNVHDLTCGTLKQYHNRPLGPNPEPGIPYTGTLPEGCSHGCSHGCLPVMTTPSTCRKFAASPTIPGSSGPAPGWTGGWADAPYPVARCGGGECRAANSALCGCLARTNRTLLAPTFGPCKVDFEGQYTCVAKTRSPRRT